MLRARADQSRSDLEVLFEYVERRTKDEPRFKSSVVEMYAYNALRANWFVRVAVMLLGLFVKPGPETIRYFFWGTKFDELILGLPPESVCVVGGPKQLLFCLRNRRTFLPSMALWKMLSRTLMTSRSESPKAIIWEIDKTAKRLSRHACPNAVFVVDNDSLPMQRAMIVSGRRAGLKSVCIQDGIFQSKSASHIMDGWFADKFFAINEAQKMMLVEKGMCGDKIKVMGFYASPYVPVRPLSPPGQRKVCFFGQPWGKYDERLRRRYLDIVADVYSWGKREGVDVFYKPHPWERGEDYLDGIKHVDNSYLEQTFENYDVFLSLTSTALIEAAAAGRIAIQLRDDAFDADDFSITFGLFSVCVSTGQNLADGLREVMSWTKHEAAPHSSPVAGFMRSLNDATSIG